MILVALVVPLVLVMAWLRRRFGKPDAGAARPSTPDEEERAQLSDDKSDAPTRYVRGGFLVTSTSAPAWMVAVTSHALRVFSAASTHNSSAFRRLERIPKMGENPARWNTWREPPACRLSLGPRLSDRRGLLAMCCSRVSTCSTAVSLT
jgi:hypothetical protein